MNLWWGKSMGATIPGGKGMNEFLSSERGTPPFPQYRKPCVNQSVKKFKAPIWLSPTPEVGENLRSPNAQ